MSKLSAALLVIASAAFSSDDQDLPSYRDVAADVGLTRPNRFGSPAKKLITETTGSGGAFLDYDADGRLDLYIVNGQTLDEATAGEPGAPNQLYRNRGGGGFELVEGAGVGDTGWGGGAAAADYDNDGDTDLFVTNYGANVLYRNNGDGTFTDVTESAGVADERWSTSAAFGDVNGDGFLDLYVCNYIAFTTKLLDDLDPQFCIWRGVPVMCGPNGLPGEVDALYFNRGDGSFEDVTERAGVRNPEGKGLGVSFVDFDGDGDEDIYVTNDSTPDFLYENDGQGNFQDVALMAGVAISMYGKPQAGMGADTGDFDGDGRPDLVVTNFQGDYNALRRNDGMGLFTDVSDALGLTAPSFEKLGWGAKFVDVNRDGALDIFVANGHVYPEVDSAGIGESYRQTNQVFLNLDSGRRFEDISTRVGRGLSAQHSSRGVAVGDIDDDLDLDIFINNMDEPPTLLVDTTRHENGAVRLTLVGRKTNRDGLGVVVELEVAGTKLWRSSGAVSSYLSTSDRRVTVGIGRAPRATAVTIRWPSGVMELGELPAGSDVVVVEGVGRIH